MLIGWLFSGGLLAGGKIKSEIKRAKAIENNKETYVDACGKKRYVNSNLLYDKTYEKLKDPDLYYYKDVRFWEEAYRRNEEKCEGNEQLRKMFEDRIEQEKIKAENSKKFFEKYDNTAKKRLIKEGYKF